MAGRKPGDFLLSDDELTCPEASGKKDKKEKDKEKSLFEQQTTDAPIWTPMDDKVVNYKFDFDKLEGHSNYEEWSASMTMALFSLGLREIIIDGAKPAADASDAHKQAYNRCIQAGVYLFLQTLSRPILKTVNKMLDPHAIWIHLRTNYRRETPMSIVNELKHFTQLQQHYSPSSTSIGDFINEYEASYQRLYDLASSTSSTKSSNKSLATYLEDDTTKRDFLLCFLADHHENVVDNLTTKPDLVYSKAKARLLNLDRSQGNSDAAYKVATTGKKEQTGSSSKVCTYCKKHGGNPNGHEWKECRKLKAANDKKKDKKKEKKKENKEEKAKMADSSQSVRYPKTWYFHTGATSHMTADRNLF